MLRVLCIGDPHFQDSTRLRHEEFIEKAVSLSEKLRPDRIVIMGDTLDRFKLINQYNLHNAHVFIKRLSLIAPLFVLIGNHDRPTNDDFMSPIHPFEGLEMADNSRIRIVYETQVIYEDILEKSLVYVPYVTNGRFMEALAYKDVVLSNVYCIFAHQEFRGCDYRGIKSESGDEWDKNAPFVISGHIHKYQRLGRNIIYVGAPIQFSQDEEVGKTVSLFTFAKNKEPEEERISLGCKEFKTIKMNVKEFAEWKYDDKCYWHITILDIEGKIKLLVKDKKYNELKKQGVVIIPISSSNVTIEDIKQVFSDQVIDYNICLYNRIKEDELMKYYLQKCRDESN